jgi:hypothetical protein
MKLLFSILTSSKPELLKLCYESVKNQEGILDFEYDIVVIVNTKNTEYINQVREVLPVGVNIKETESNGRPGKGHNSVLENFKNSEEYDYCAIVDGDDFLYPRALTRLQQYLKYNPDILLINFHDKIQAIVPPEEHNVPYFSIQNKAVLFYNLTDVTIKAWYNNKGSLNPFNTDINHLNTVARPFVFSRKSLEYDIYYDENMKLYDDFIVFMKCFELSLLGNLKVYGIVDSHIYLYNLFSQNSATVKYFDMTDPESEIERINENNNFVNSLKNKFLLIKSWDLTKFPLLELGQIDEQDNLLAKYKYVDQLLVKIDLPPIESCDNIELVTRFCEENRHTIIKEELKQISLLRQQC